MLDINVSIRNDKVIIKGLNRFVGKAPGAVRRGLAASAKSIYTAARSWLSGPGAKKSKTNPGGYPVPVRTGHLRRSLNWLHPGETKSSAGLTFSAGPFEAVIYDSAEYASVIHEGKRSSAAYGPRRFLADAFDAFNRGGNIKKKIEAEINKIKP